jgi:hypothetical protein
MTTPGRLREDRWVVHNAQAGGRAEWSVFPMPKPSSEVSTPVAPVVRPASAPAVPSVQPSEPERQMESDAVQETSVETVRPVESLPVVRHQPVAPLTLALASVASGQIAVTLPRRPLPPAPTEEDYRQADRAHLRRRCQ